MPLIVAHSSTISLTGIATLTLDTRGATVIYMFGQSVFGVGLPPGGYDNQGNTWFLMANPFSTCNGGMNGLRVFNPTTSASHVFRISGNPSFETSLIVVAFTPTFASESFTREIHSERSGVNPVQPGEQTPLGNNRIIISAAGAGCGWDGAPTVDSGFSLIEYTDVLGVAYLVQNIAAPINPTWSTLLPGGIGGSKGGVLQEGIGIFTGGKPVVKNTVNKVYES